MIPAFTGEQDTTPFPRRCYALMPHSGTVIMATWLNRNVPDVVIDLAGCSVYRLEQMRETGKK